MPPMGTPSHIKRPTQHQRARESSVSSQQTGQMAAKPGPSSELRGEHIFLHHARKLGRLCSPSYHKRSGRKPLQCLPVWKPFTGKPYCLHYSQQPIPEGSAAQRLVVHPECNAAPPHANLFAQLLLMFARSRFIQGTFRSTVCTLTAGQSSSRLVRSCCLRLALPTELWSTYRQSLWTALLSSLPQQKPKVCVLSHYSLITLCNRAASCADNLAEIMQRHPHTLSMQYQHLSICLTLTSLALQTSYPALSPPKTPAQPRPQGTHPAGHQTATVVCQLAPQTLQQVWTADRTVTSMQARAARTATHHPQLPAAATAQTATTAKLISRGSALMATTTASQAAQRR